MPTPLRPPIMIMREFTHPTHSASPIRPKKFRGPRVLTALLSTLATLALVHFLIVLHTNNSRASMPPTCANLIRTTDYTKYVQFDPSSQQVGAIQYVDQVLGGQPGALVQVMDAQHTLDVYVYGCIQQHTTPVLTVLFKQQSLMQGTVSVSKAGTLMLAERDTTLSQETTAVIQPMQQNLYQEYHWQNDTFSPLLFPGLYPVTSRSEAEGLQEQANNGDTLPWNDPQTTTQQMAKDILQWSPDKYQEKVLDNDGTTAHILLEQKQLAMAVTVTLTRIIQKDTKGLWFVTHAQTQGITLDAAQWPTLLTSPVVLHGTTQTHHGQVTATLFDHTITTMSSLNSAALSLSSDGSYTGNILYTGNKLAQQGLLLIEHIPANDGTEAGQLSLSGVLLS